MKRLILLAGFLFLTGCEQVQDHHVRIHMLLKDTKTGEVHRATLTEPSDRDGDYDLVTSDQQAR